MIKCKLREEFLSYFNYAGYKIGIYYQKESEEAVKFCFLDQNNELTQETIWIPKALLINNKYDKEYYGLERIFDKYGNQEKLRKIGYRL